MFDNLLHQRVSSTLTDDIIAKTLPQSLLFAGPFAAGKLTAALELARILSCQNPHASQWGQWQCACQSCLLHKSLTSTELLLTGPRECLLEIEAARKTFLQACANSESFLPASRYLFVRSIRKLTQRFNPVLWEGDDKVSKIAPLVSAVDELLEELDPQRTLPELNATIKLADQALEACKKLDSSFMYDSLPVSLIRRASSWMYLTSTGNRKTLIVENADRMQESARNALLKVLEEPPPNSLFILTASNRGAVMPTILSRVRTYSFLERSCAEQREVISRVFREAPDEYTSVDQYLQTFLPVSAQTIKNLAKSFLLSVPSLHKDFTAAAQAVLPNVEPITMEQLLPQAKNFEPRMIFKLFCKELLAIARIGFQQNPTAHTQQELQQLIKLVTESYNAVIIYNQSPAAVLELLLQKMSVKAGAAL